MKAWSSRSLLAVGLTLAGLGAAAGPALADPIGQAQEEFLRGSAKAEAALEQALREAAPEAQSALERAIAEVRAARERTVEDLGRAREASRPSATGLAQAREAVDRGTQTHLRVLGELLERVPAAARPGIERALEISRTGRETALRALEGERASRRPARPRDVGEGPPSGPPAGVPGHSREGMSGAPRGIPGGPPGGLPGGPGGVRGGPPTRGPRR